MQRVVAWRPLTSRRSNRSFMLRARTLNLFDRLGAIASLPKDAVERTCKLCNAGLEDQRHFVVECAAFASDCKPFCFSGGAWNAWVMPLPCDGCLPRRLMTGSDSVLANSAWPWQ